MTLRFSFNSAGFRKSGILVFVVALSAVLIASVLYTARMKSMVGTYTGVIHSGLIPIGDSIMPLLPIANVLLFLAGGIVLILICHEHIFADRYTYFVVSSYLLYFPLAGMNWGSFTVMSLFPPLFLMGYYAYVVDRRVLSAVMFLLAAATFQAFSVLVIVAGITIMSYDRKEVIPARENYLGISLLLIPVLLLVTTDFHSGFMGFNTGVSSAGYGMLLPLFHAFAGTWKLFFILLLIPIVTYGFFGPRVIPVTVPFYVFGLITTIAGGSPETLVAILSIALPLSYLGTIRWIGKKVEFLNPVEDNRIITFAIISLILVNVLIVLVYFPVFQMVSGLFSL